VKKNDKFSVSKSTRKPLHEENHESFSQCQASHRVRRKSKARRAGGLALANRKEKDKTHELRPTD
jgi:hypothetical protein